MSSNMKLLLIAQCLCTVAIALSILDAPSTTTTTTSNGHLCKPIDLMIVMDVSGSQLKYSLDDLPCEGTKNVFLDTFTDLVFANTEKLLSHRYAIVKHNDHVLHGSGLQPMLDFQPALPGRCDKTDRIICGGERVTVCGGATSLLSGLNWTVENWLPKADPTRKLVLLWQTDGFSNSDGDWLKSGLERARQAYLEHDVTIVGVQVGTIGNPEHLQNMRDLIGEKESETQLLVRGTAAEAATAAHASLLQALECDGPRGGGLPGGHEPPPEAPEQCTCPCACSQPNASPNNYKLLTKK